MARSCDGGRCVLGGVGMCGSRREWSRWRT